MKKIFGTALFVFVNIVQSLYAMNYGLHFNSHSSPVGQRTSLLLNNQKSFELKNEFMISFDFMIRQEPIFGMIFNAQTDDGQSIDVLFSVKDDDTYYPALVINDALNLMDGVTVKNGETSSIIFSILKDENKIILTYNRKTLALPLQLGKAMKVNITFGNQPQAIDRNDVAPINVRDIRVFENKKNTHHWELKQHNGDICYDLLQQLPAEAINPHWILNDHTEWKDIYTLKTNEKIQIAFNPNENLFYLVQQDKITTFSPMTRETGIIPIKQGYRAMMYSNYIEYDTLTNTLLSYSLKKKMISRFDFRTQSWSLADMSPDEPTFANHTWAMTDSLAYAFGGYGFYQFNNKLFCLNLQQDSILECLYEPSISPRNSSASAVVGDELYIFGGRGNSTGKQEMPSRYYYDLYAINLKTMKSRKVWEIDSVKSNFLLAPTMYFVPKDSSFYAATTQYGGTLIRLPLNEPRFDMISKPIQDGLIFRDMVFNLYSAVEFDKMYLVIDKRMSDLSHDLSIYSIDCPFMENNQTEQILQESWYKKLNLTLLFSLTGGICLLFLCLGIIIRKKKEKASKKARMRTTPTPLSGPEENTEPEMVYMKKKKEEKKYFDRSKSAISLLGGFNVRDKEGKDITMDFTPRAKSLLVMLLLYSEKNTNGILIKKLDDVIWPDKDEESARNNRNVYMRKLRLLLENIGDVEIVNDKGYFRINLGENVFFDYHVALTYIKMMEENDKSDKEVLHKTLELLLYGALLPNTTYEWLDDFKGEYSSTSITLLNNLLRHELTKTDDDLAFNIADTIFLHDPLSEEALSAKCSILCNRKMKGIAKNVYDKFCKEYKESLGEEYDVSFADICNKPL